MKRKIIASVLGMAACAAVTSAYGQGSVFFNNYYLNSSSTIVAVAPITFASNGHNVGSEFNVDLLYSFGAGIGTTWTLTPGSLTPILAGNDGDPTSAGAGIFGGSSVTIPGYTSGPIDFIVEAFNGTSYGNSSIIGQSGVVQLSSIATGTAIPGDLYTGAITPLAGFTVSPVPEPATLALVGFGGLASLVALRRQKS